MKIIDPNDGGGKLTDHLEPGAAQRILIVFWHGVGDVVMMLAPLQALRWRFPKCTFDVGLANGLQQEVMIPDAVLLDGNWRETVESLGYDIVFLLHFNCEDVNQLEYTKAQLACIRELGIDPIAGHVPIRTKKLVATHFHMTSIPGLANATADTAKQIWNDIIEAGCVPVDTHFQHGFHNPENVVFDWLENDNNVRKWPARLDTMISLIAHCDAFVGVVSGNFHVALSTLGPKRVMLLERDLPRECFTKHDIATANLKNYQGEVKSWLQNL